MGLRPGAVVTFKPDRGKARNATIERVSTGRGQARVTLEGDPFPVSVRLDQLSSCKLSDTHVPSKPNLRNIDSQGESKTMTTTRRPDAKALRKQAQALGIKGWEDMGRAELASAVKKAESGGSKSTKKRRTSSGTKKTTTKARKAPAAKKAAAPAKKTSGARKTAAKKAAAQKKTPAKTKSEPVYTDPPRGVDAPDEPVNPFRKGSNLHIIYPILVPRGGKRRTLAERLQKKVDLHPYSGADTEVDLIDYDKRILLAAQTLRDKFGYVIERNGRGLDGTVRVFIPGSENDPRSSNGKAKPKRARKK